MKIVAKSLVILAFVAVAYMVFTDAPLPDIANVSRWALIWYCIGEIEEIKDQLKKRG